MSNLQLTLRRVGLKWLLTAALIIYFLNQKTSSSCNANQYDLQPKIVDWLKIKGILTDVEKRALSEFSKPDFFAYFRSSPLRSTLPQRNQAKIILEWNESNFHRKVSYTRLYSTQKSMGAMNHTKSCITWKRKIGMNWNFGNKLFSFYIFWFMS